MKTETPSDLRIDIISDVVCPWCIVGYSQLKAAADALGKTLDVHWHPFELNPNMPAEGQNLREHIIEKYGSTAEESEKMRATLTGMGEDFGFEFNFEPGSRIVNTLQAHKLIRWAAEEGRQHELKLVLIRRYFTEGQDVSKDDVLLDAVKEVGLDIGEASKVLSDDAASLQVRAEERAWMSRGVSGVPSMIFEEKYLVTGAQGVETYTDIIQQLSAAEAV